MELGQRYARALFKVAEESCTMELVKRDLGNLKDAINHCPELVYILRVSSIPKRVINQVLNDLSTGFNLSRLTSNFLHILSVNGRKHILSQIINSFEDLLDENQIMKASVTSFECLSIEQKNSIKNFIKTIIGKDGKIIDVDLKEYTDPSLLGGFIIRFGSYLVDTSIKTQLDRFYKVSVSYMV